ncbi:hypothetical protein A3K73_09350 [Candidatus Pacearchaeota archaeon RBG_13_36_9]|nr:MAG: hypothetical protein A3K73_09350 [Candidatus Pacearchaeota archaeon RBG_13_36_9]
MLKQEKQRGQDKMGRTRVYHGESYKGAVVANFFVEGKNVRAYFCDGDISSHKVTYKIVLDGKNYRIVEIEDMDTPLDGQFGKNPPRTKSKKVNATTEQDALKAMIDYIVQPYETPSEFGFPVNARMLRNNLEKKLLLRSA